MTKTNRMAVERLVRVAEETLTQALNSWPVDRIDAETAVVKLRLAIAYYDGKLGKIVTGWEPLGKKGDV